MLKPLSIILCLLLCSLALRVDSQPAGSMDNATEGVKPGGEFVVEPIEGLVLREKDIRAGLLYDTERGVVVWEKDMNYAYPIASLTKMMVALLATEDVRAGKVDWSDEVKVQRVYKRAGRRKGSYTTTETYTLESLVQLAMIPSNNQACSDIGIFLSGDVPAFVKRMNEKAAELRMRNTFYSNPSGLPAAMRESDNSASPHDLLLLSLEMIKYEEILKITSIGYAEVSNDKRSGIFRNHNHLVINYENDVDGLKTGFTKRAKFCLAATSRKEGHRLIAIVLGVDGPYLRNEIVASMLNNYYEHIGCGAMIPTTGGPVASKSLLSDPAKDDIDVDDANVTYKTVWTKQKRSHLVRSGESLSLIARKYNSTYQQIRKWNGLSGDKIYAGQRLLVYVNVPQKVAIRNEPASDTEDDTDPIENDGAISVTESVAVNEQPETDAVATPGDITPATAEIIKPAVTAKSPAVAKQPLTHQSPVKNQVSRNKYLYHVVQPGDTLWSIAQRYDGISADEIKKVNRIYNPRGLKPGTRLKIKVVAGS